MTFSHSAIGSSSAANDNFLYSLKAEDGIVDWRLRTGADVVSKPVADRESRLLRLARQRAARG